MEYDIPFSVFVGFFNIKMLMQRYFYDFVVADFNHVHAQLIHVVTQVGQRAVVPRL